MFEFMLQVIGLISCAILSVLGLTQVVRTITRQRNESKYKRLRNNIAELIQELRTDKPITYSVYCVRKALEAIGLGKSGMSAYFEMQTHNEYGYEEVPIGSNVVITHECAGLAKGAEGELKEIYRSSQGEYFYAILPFVSENNVPVLVPLECFLIRSE